MPDRTVVAASEDQQWLVTHEGDGWVVWRRCVHAYLERMGLWATGAIPDTGQSADEVLRGFLEEQDGSS